MMQAIDPVYLEAFAQLLARPDPRDLPRRAHVRRFEGDPNRRATRLPGILMAWLQRRHLAIDNEEPLAPATRTWPRRRFERHAGLERRGRPANPGLRVLHATATG